VNKTKRQNVELVVLAIGSLIGIVAYAFFGYHDRAAPALLALVALIVFMVVYGGHLVEKGCSEMEDTAREATYRGIREVGKRLKQRARQK